MEKEIGRREDSAGWTTPSPECRQFNAKGNLKKGTWIVTRFYTVQLLVASRRWCHLHDNVRGRSYVPGGMRLNCSTYTNEA